MAKVYVHNSIVNCMPQGNRVSMKSFSNEERAVFVRDKSLVLDLAYNVIGSIFNRFELFGERALAHLVFLSRGLHVKSFMGAYGIVNLAPLIKMMLTMSQVPKNTIFYHLGIESPVKSLVLALGLRVSGPAMDNTYSQADQPYGKLGMGAVKAPGRTVIHQHALGKTIGPEYISQLVRYSFRSLIAAGFYAKGKSRMIVNYSQRMAAALIKGEVPFKVHLPQAIGLLTLKSLPGTVFFRFLRIYQVVPFEDICNRAGCRNKIMALHEQAGLNLTASPGRVIVSNCKYRSLKGIRRLTRTVMGSSRTILHNYVVILEKAFYPLVPCLGADPKTAAQLANIGSII